MDTKDTNLMEKTLEQHYETLYTAIDLALKGRFFLGLESLDAHVTIKQSLEAIGKAIKHIEAPKADNQAGK